MVLAEDVLQQGAPEVIRDKVYKALGNLDILVNSAGGSRPIPWDAGDDAWHEGMTLNFEMLRRLTMAFIPGMRAQKYGRVINITGSSEPRGNSFVPSRCRTRSNTKRSKRAIATAFSKSTCRKPMRPNRSKSPSTCINSGD